MLPMISPGPKDDTRERLPQHVLLGFCNGTLARWYSGIMLSPPQNMKPYLGSTMRAYSLLRVLLCFLTY